MRKELFPSQKDFFLTQKELFLSWKELFLPGKELFLPGKELFLPGKELFLSRKAFFSRQKEFFMTAKVDNQEWAKGQRGHIAPQPSRREMSATRVAASPPLYYLGSNETPVAPPGARFLSERREGDLRLLKWEVKLRRRLTERR